MKTIETTILVDEEGKATLHLPADVAPGPHRVSLTIEEAETPRKPFRVEDLPQYDIPWPFAPDETFRREDMYDDEGRLVGIDVHRRERPGPGDGQGGPAA